MRKMEACSVTTKNLGADRCRKLFRDNDSLDPPAKRSRHAIQIATEPVSKAPVNPTGMFMEFVTGYLRAVQPQPSERSMDFAKDYLIHSRLDAIKRLATYCTNCSPDVFLTFLDNGEPVKVHFNRGIVESNLLYQQPKLTKLLDAQGEVASGETLHHRVQNLYKHIFEKLAVQSPKVRLSVGMEFLSCMFCAHSVLEDPEDILQLASLARYMSLPYIYCWLRTIRLHDVSRNLPSMIDNRVCYYHSSLRPGRDPAVIRCGWHLDFDLNQWFRLELANAGGYQAFPLIDSERGVFHDNENGAAGMAEKYRLSRSLSYAISKPGSSPLDAVQRSKCLHLFLFHVYQLTRNSLEIYEAQEKGLDWLDLAGEETCEVQTRVDYGDDIRNLLMPGGETERAQNTEEDAFEKAKKLTQLFSKIAAAANKKQDDESEEDSMRRWRKHLGRTNEMRLQILGCDEEAVRSAWNSLPTEQRDFIKVYFFGQDMPTYFFDKDTPQPFCRVTSWNEKLMLEFLKHFSCQGSADKGLALQMRNPKGSIVERLPGAVKVVGFDPLCYFYYIIQPTTESLLRVMEHLFNDVTPPAPSSAELHIVEVPDFFKNNYYAISSSTPQILASSKSPSAAASPKAGVSSFCQVS